MPPYAVAVAVLAHGFWWFFLYPRVQAVFRSVRLSVGFDSLSWGQRLWLRTPWVFPAGSVLLVLAALWITLGLRGRTRSLAMFVLFILLATELVWFFHSIITMPWGGLSSSIH